MTNYDINRIAAPTDTDTDVPDMPADASKEVSVDSKYDRNKLINRKNALVRILKAVRALYSDDEWKKKSWKKVGIRPTEIDGTEDITPAEMAFKYLEMGDLPVKYELVDDKPKYVASEDAPIKLTEAINKIKEMLSTTIKEPSSKKPSRSSPASSIPIGNIIETQLFQFNQAKRRKDFSTYPASFITEIEDIWKPKSTDIPFGARAGILVAMESWLKKKAAILPKSVSALAKGLTDSTEEAATSFAQQLLDSNKKYDKADVKNEEFLTWAVGYKLWDVLKKTGEWPQAIDFQKEVDQFSSSVYKLMSEAVKAQKIKETLEGIKSKEMQTLLRSTEDIQKANLPKDVEKRMEVYEKAMDDLLDWADEADDESGFGTGLTPTEIKNRDFFEAVKNEFEKDYPGLAHFSSSSSSYKEGITRMNKTATYHGVLEQGHPEGPYKGWTYLDKRYLKKEHFDAIIASAKEKLGEAWFKSNWEGGSPDAQARAALDLAIATADGSAYQSKIDSPTYNMLLNKLENYGLDLFQDTLLPPTSGEPKKREASQMNPVQDMLRIASELESTHPHLSLQIVANTRALAGEIHTASADTVALPVEMLVKLAFNNPGTRGTLLPIIAAKKPKAAKKKSSKKTSTKKAPAGSHSASEEPKTSSKKKKASPKKATKRKASVELSIDDSGW